MSWLVIIICPECCCDDVMVVVVAVVDIVVVDVGDDVDCRLHVAEGRRSRQHRKSTLTQKKLPPLLHYYILQILIHFC